MNYQEQLKHPKWQKRRLEILEAQLFTCEECGATDQQLHVHHSRYRRGAMAWEYEDWELSCLCHICHKAMHDLDEKLHRALASPLSNLAVKEIVTGFLRGCNGCKPETDNEAVGSAFAEHLIKQNNGRL